MQRWFTLPFIAVDQLCNTVELFRTTRDAAEVLSCTVQRSSATSRVSDVTPPLQQCSEPFSVYAVRTPAYSRTNDFESTPLLGREPCYRTETSRLARRRDGAGLLRYRHLLSTGSAQLRLQ